MGKSGPTFCEQFIIIKGDENGLIGKAITLFTGDKLNPTG